MIDLFPEAEKVGVFRGFREGGMEFHADLSIPYRPHLHNIPMHGQFILVQLEHPEEAVLGRITSLSAQGRLTSISGEQYTLRAMSENRQIPENLREEYLQYRVDIRVLGVIRSRADGEIVFVPSHRRLPHVGSPVSFPSNDVMCKLVGSDGEGAELGHFALGEYIYADGDGRVRLLDWMQIKAPNAPVRFHISNLVSRRSFVFARAGFGKSNLTKLLFSTLYKETPTVEKRGGRQVPVGTLVFDPDGEYFWPDDKGRPGLCDVTHLQDRIVVFTSRDAPGNYYGSFVAGGVKLDIRRLHPSDVISIALSPEKQDQQNVRKLRGMNLNDWGNLVDLIYDHGNGAHIPSVMELLKLDTGQEVEALAARANMTTTVKMLHDPSSQLMDMLIAALSNGKLCVVDVSQLGSGQSLILSGLILRRIFDRNQEEFTKAQPQTIPTIAVVEEAQSVLTEKSSAAIPYIEWVKEGRKYDLGAMLITQQPGSIPNEILSQGDNWFLFHLLSSADLKNVKSANAHFSDDLLSSLLNEPIPGQGVFWSSAGNTMYPIPFKVLSFEDMYNALDPHYERGKIDTYAAQLKSRFDASIPQAALTLSSDQKRVEEEISDYLSDSDSSREGTDILKLNKKRAIETLKTDQEFWDSIDKHGIPWGVVLGKLASALPDTMDDRNNYANQFVPEAMDQLLGQESWKTERKGTKNTTFIVKDN